MQDWSLGQEDPLKYEMAAYSDILPWRAHGQRSLAGYSSWGHNESDTTEHAHAKGHKGSGKITTRTQVLFLVSLQLRQQEMIYHTCATYSCNWELVQNVTGPGKGPNGTIFKEQGGPLKGGWGDHNGHRCPRSTETSSKQQEYSPTICISVPGLWLPLFLLLWLPWVHKFTWASSFFFWSSACTFTSLSTSLSRCRSFSEDGAKAERNPGLLNHNKVHLLFNH